MTKQLMEKSVTPPSGILLVDKPSGWTSHDVVQKLRLMLKTKAIGHTGTLDPLASGLLVLCVGKATKFVKFFSLHDKTYQAEILLGIQTDTDDITGHIVRTGDPSMVTDAMIHQALARFNGTMTQIPPAFSAIKVDGKKLYQYARNQQEIPIVAQREIDIRSIRDVTIERFPTNVRLRLTLEVSKGTYIRSIARDLGNDLQVGGCLNQLRRVQVGKYQLKDAQTLDEMACGDVRYLDPLVALGLPRFQIEATWIKKIANGMKMPIAWFHDLNPTIIVSPDGQPLAIYEPDALQDYMRMSVKLS